MSRHFPGNLMRTSCGWTALSIPLDLNAYHHRFSSAGPARLWSTISGDAPRLSQNKTCYPCSRYAANHGPQGCPRVSSYNQPGKCISLVGDDPLEVLRQRHRDSGFSRLHSWLRLLFSRGSCQYVIKCESKLVQGEDAIYRLGDRLRVVPQAL